MAYLGNSLQAAYSSYLLIDSLSASFNGTTTSFALKVNGVTPVPFPLNEQNVLISVGGVPQKPDPTGAEGFKFSGTNIVFSSAPKTGEAFWGVVLAGADYVNVGVSYPDGTAATPSITFNTTKTTGLYLAGISTLGFATAGILRSTIDSNGNLSVVSTGSATAPAVAVGTGTTYAPGIYSPGTDQLAISTSGTGRLIINSTGQISIPHTVTSLTTTIAINNTDSTNGTGNRIALQSSGTNVAAFDWDYTSAVFNTNISSYGNIIFKTTGASPTEKMRLDGSGNLGLGVTPSAQYSTVKALQVGALGATIIAGNTSAGGTSAFGQNYYTDATTAAFKYAASSYPATAYHQYNGEHRWFNAPSGTAGNTITFTQAMTLDASGRLGLGTSSPLTTLSVAGGISGGTSTALNSDIAFPSVATNSYLRLVGVYQSGTGRGGTIQLGGRSFSDSGNVGAFLISGESNGNFNTTDLTISTQTSFNNVISELLRVTATGRVGIGTTSPGAQFEINNGGTSSSASGGTLARVVGSAVSRLDIVGGNTSYSILEFSRANLTAAGQITYDHTNNALAFTVNGASEKARIDSSGRLLVGTSSTLGGSSAFFQILGSAGSPTANATMLLARGSLPTSGDIIGYLSFNDNSGNAGAAINSTADANWTSGSSHPSRLVFSTTPSGSASPTERMRIGSNGFLKVSPNGTYFDVTGNHHELYTYGSSPYLLWATHAGTGSTPNGITINYSAATPPNNTSNEFLRCFDTNGSVLRASIRSNGGLANYQANNVNLSDLNTKKDISPAADTWSCVKEWEIVNYRYKDQPDDSDLNLGVIAQQVAESCPEVITIFQESKEATDKTLAQEKRLGIKEQQMYWMAIKALQEAMERIETLEAKITALGGK